MNFINRYILLFLVFFLLSAYLIFKFINADPKGYCSGQTYNGAVGPYISDEEFLLIGMKASGYVYTEDGKRLSNPSKEETRTYIAKYPGCCRLYRDLASANGPETSNGILRRAFGMKQFVIVAFREFEDVLKQPRFVGFERYKTLDTCGAIYSN